MTHDIKPHSEHPYSGRDPNKAREWRRKYYLTHKDLNREKKQAYRKKYYILHKEQELEKNRLRAIDRKKKFPEKYKESLKKRYSKNRDKLLEKQRLQRSTSDGREKARIRLKAWRIKNPKLWSQYARSSRIKRRATVEGKLNHTISNGIRDNLQSHRLKSR